MQDFSLPVAARPSNSKRLQTAEGSEEIGVGLLRWYLWVDLNSQMMRKM